MILAAAAASKRPDLLSVNGSFTNVMEREGLLQSFLWPGYTPEDWELPVPGKENGGLL